MSAILQAVVIQALCGFAGVVLGGVLLKMQYRRAERKRYDAMWADFTQSELAAMAPRVLCDVRVHCPMCNAARARAGT